MDQIKVELLQVDDLKWLYYGYRICTDTLEKVEDTKDIVKNALNSEIPHLSPLKHLIYKFLITGIPRSLLQEVVRHQIGVAINVKSTRFTLHRMTKDENLNKDSLDYFNKIEEVVKKYYFIPDSLKNNPFEYEAWVHHRYSELLTIKFLRQQAKTKNDDLKSYINENFRTDVYMTISALALRNMFWQRFSKHAWLPFRHLVKLMYYAIPEEHHFLYYDVVNL